MKAPFPWFGGKRRVASIVWERFGEVATYNEPFAGSLAVLLERPHEARIETVNDLDCYLANFWRALQADPDAVSFHADGPVNEADVHARHRWLVEVARPTAERVMNEPDFFDAKIAGWWVWGQCLWIGSGWCQRPEWTGRHSIGGKAHGVNSAQYGHAATSHWKQRPHLTESQGINKPSVTEQYGRAGYGVEQARRPQLSGDQGVIAKKRPGISGNGGSAGVHRRWQGGGQAGGPGVHAPSLSKKKPALNGDSGASGHGIHASGFEEKTGGLYEYMRALAARLRRVRVCCGDWKRVLTPSVTTYIGVTGVLLDPPYAHDLRERCYSEDHDVSGEVREWAIANGDNPDMRIALCGYEGEHVMPGDWECVAWKAHGGYSRSERAKANRARERIWFSPACLRPEQEELDWGMTKPLMKND